MIEQDKNTTDQETGQVPTVHNPIKAPLVVSKKKFSLVPTSMVEAMEFAKMMCRSELVPKDFRGKPESVMIAVQMGMEVGLAPMQAIQNIAVINGRPCMWGDAVLAVVQASKKMEWIKEWQKDNAAYCQTKRIGYPEPYTVAFTMEDAKKAKLLDNPNKPTWKTHTARMRQMRARAFNLRDQYADVLRGLAIREEVEDYITEPVNDMPKRKSETQTVATDHVEVQPPINETATNPDPKKNEPQKPPAEDYSICLFGKNIGVAWADMNYNQLEFYDKHFTKKAEEAKDPESHIHKYKDEIEASHIHVLNAIKAIEEGEPGFNG